MIMIIVTMTIIIMNILTMMIMMMIIMTMIIMIMLQPMSLLTSPLELGPPSMVEGLTNPSNIVTILAIFNLILFSFSYLVIACATLQFFANKSSFFYFLTFSLVLMSSPLSSLLDHPNSFTMIQVITNSRRNPQAPPSLFLDVSVTHVLSFLSFMFYLHFVQHHFLLILWAYHILNFGFETTSRLCILLKGHKILSEKDNL